MSMTNAPPRDSFFSEIVLSQSFMFNKCWPPAHGIILVHRLLTLVYRYDSFNHIRTRSDFSKTGLKILVTKAVGIVANKYLEYLPKSIWTCLSKRS